METPIVWMSLLATLLLAVTRGASAAEPWRAVEQPELQQALERAPVLQPESLGEPARGVNSWENWLVPNPDGKSWDALQIYFKEYRGPTWLFAVDLGTGQVKKQRLPDSHQFYLSGRTLGFDGKWALHPDQVTILNEVFSPTQEQFDRAWDILDAYRLATEDEGKGAVMFGDEMIDEASRKMALKFLSRGERAGLKRSEKTE